MSATAATTSAEEASGSPATSSFRNRSRDGRRRLESRTTFISDALQFSASVLPRIMPSVLCITLYASVIAVGDLLYEKDWKTSNSVIGPLSVVVGLLVVFRNGTSYDRWYEGRKVWQDASATVRNMAILLWCNVDVDGSAKKEVAESKRPWRMERKKRAVRLLIAFMVALKHDLRSELGTNWQDLRGLLPEGWQTSYGSIDDRFGYDRSGSGQQGSSSSPEGVIAPAKAGDIESSGERQPLLLPDETADRLDESTDLPTQILTALHVYIAGLQRSNLLPSPPFHGVLLGNLTSLGVYHSSLSRIATTTIPLVYNIHLKQCCLLYLLALPLTLVGELSWRMVPFVTLVAITLMGLEGISSEIEDPFGHDKSDHPLDEWCDELKRDLERLLEETEGESQEE